MKKIAFRRIQERNRGQMEPQDNKWKLKEVKIEVHHVKTPLVMTFKG